jgi:hypothetical protein
MEMFVVSALGIITMERRTSQLPLNESTTHADEPLVLVSTVNTAEISQPMKSSIGGRIAHGPEEIARSHRRLSTPLLLLGRVVENSTRDKRRRLSTMHNSFNAVLTVACCG